MATETEPRGRVLLAITETSHVPKLWRAVAEHVPGGFGEVVAVFVSDERWLRAATLPFTTEISRLSGSGADFTRRRAEQLHGETVRRLRRQIEELAAGAELRLVFEVMSEYEARAIHALVRDERDIVIAPSDLKRRPVYAEFGRLKCRLLLVDDEEEPR